MSTINFDPSLFKRPNHMPRITKPCDTPLVLRATFSRAIWIIYKGSFIPQNSYMDILGIDIIKWRTIIILPDMKEPQIS